ncbi:Uncharacterised protein [Klebsiella pneumoniae]|nr:Uncharacterised protein [Klebsiella pneumoniae]
MLWRTGLMFSRRWRHVLALLFTPFYDRVVNGIGFVAGFFRIVGGVGSLHRFSRFTQFIH